MDRADYDEFSRAIRGANHEVDLFGAAMVIARLGGSAAPPHEVARRLDFMAERVRDYAGDNPTAEALAHAIDFELFTRSRFRGNTEAYTDPRNSYLDEVIERGLGIPITLSLVYLEVAARAGLECDGIGYPGHFIVRYGYPESPVYVDPFQQGARLDREELHRPAARAGFLGRQPGGLPRRRHTASDAAAHALQPAHHLPRIS